MHTTTTRRFKHLALLFALAACSQAHALPLSCDGPKPPPICNGPTPPAPMPAPPLRPGLGGGGDWNATVLTVGIFPQTVDRTKIARAVIQRGPTPDGPWQAWFDQAFTPSANPPAFYSASLVYDSVLPTTCFRGRFADAYGQYSPWSLAKCSSSTPLATQVQAQVGISSVNVSWFDPSWLDGYYRVEFTDPDGSNRQVTSVPGNGNLTGTRHVTVARPWRQANVCVRVWSIETSIGVVLGSPVSFSDSTALDAAIQPSARVCFPTPGA